MLGSLALLSAMVACGQYSDSIDIDFSTQSYDRTLFRPNLRHSTGTWEVKDGKLRAEIAKGLAGRPPINFVSLFGLEGNFEVAVDYQIVQLPKPRAATSKTNVGEPVNSIEVVLSGEPGWCVASRKSLPIGDRISSYGELEGGKRKIASDLLPVAESTGRLEARRQGDTIRFYHSESSGASLEIGSVPFGKGPIAEVSLQIYAMNTADPIEVRFSTIHIGADQVTGVFRGRSMTRRLLNWGLVVGGMVLGIFVLRRLAFGRRAGR